MSAKLSPSLVNAVREGRAVLFLGAGASLGASRSSGKEIPPAAELSKMICDQFLSSDYYGLDFKTTCDFAASNRSVRDLQSFIRDTLEGHNPALFHFLIPKFVWAGLATTNYDLIIEEVYKNSSAPLQTLVPYCKDGDGATDRLGANHLLYVKLHGCITLYQEVNPPFVASTEQIIHHRDGRAGQFAQFLEWSKTKTIIFCGYGIGDSNLRTLFDEIIKEGDNRSRHYIVRPGIKSVESLYWQERRVEALNITFEEFLTELDSEISSATRKLALVPAAYVRSSFSKFISHPSRRESDALKDYLDTRCEHISDEITPSPKKASLFYRGFDLGWYPFSEELDVPRRITQSLIDEVVLPSNPSQGARFAILKAHAGAGKSVVLRRLAWDAARRLNKLVFFIEHAGDVDAALFEEIISLVNQPAYLIIDNVAEDAGRIYALLYKARQQKWPLVVIGGSRFNEWNLRCEDLEPLLDDEYELNYLSYKEIDELLARLELHDSLGHLANLSLSDRRTQLRDIYGRQILVALHEATKNSSFRDIIRDEYNNITPREAQILYLDICALHRFGPPVRAGLIARVHGIDFHSFQERFFKPLEQVIDLKRESKTGDWAYRARHSFIAEIVYNEILSTMDERFDHMMRIVSKLNPGYSYDREVLSQLVRAGTLAETFPDRVKGDAIYEAALSSVGRDVGILHQRGIYEMRLGGDTGALDRAQKYLEEALETAPNSRSVRHSLAELALKRSVVARDHLERDAWRRQAELQATALVKADGTSHPHHTLAKAAISSVREALYVAENRDDELSQETLSLAIKGAEDVLRRGLQLFPNDSHLLNEEGTLGEILQNADRALSALKRAFDSNPTSDLLSRRLSRVLRSKLQWDEAASVLRKGLDSNPGSQVLHFDLAQTLRSRAPDADTADGENILYHLARSFAPRDRNYEAHFWYARQLCIVGRGPESRTYFEQLKRAYVPYHQRHSSRGAILDKSGQPRRFTGQVSHRADTFGFVRSDNMELEAYFSARDIRVDSADIGPRDRVEYYIDFTLSGPVAKQLRRL